MHMWTDSPCLSGESKAWKIQLQLDTQKPPGTIADRIICGWRPRRTPHRADGRYLSGTDHAFTGDLFAISIRTVDSAGNTGRLTRLRGLA
jgi:hypothetical protein